MMKKIDAVTAVQMFKFYKGLVGDGAPDAVAAELMKIKFGVSAYDAAYYLNKWCLSKKLYIDFAKKYLVWQLRRHGMSVAEIAKYAEVSRQSVYKMLARDCFYYNPKDELIYYKRIFKQKN